MRLRVDPPQARPRSLAAEAGALELGREHRLAGLCGLVAEGEHPAMILMLTAADSTADRVAAMRR